MNYKKNNVKNIFTKGNLMKKTYKYCIIIICIAMLTSIAFLFQNPKENIVNANAYEQNIIRGGFIPDEDNPIETLEPVISNKNELFSSPQSYFRLDDKYLLNVENQDGMGLCWAFAGLKTIESFIAMNFNEYYNFSEAWLALIKAECQSYSIGGGGNYQDLEIINQYGIMLESDFPYEIVHKIGDNNDHQFYEAYKDKASKSLISNISFKEYGDYNNSPGKTQIINGIKDYLQRFSSVFVAIKSGDIKEDIDGNYYVNSKITHSDHAVSIIGWDDEYSVEGSTGAWIAQNSWGAAGDTDKTYFYIMYDDVNASDYYAMIHKITYNGYEINTENLDDITSYNKIKLESSNSNYVNLNISGDLIADNLFLYTEDTEYFNTLTYSYIEYNNVNIEVEVFNGINDITNDFDVDIDDINKTISITSKNSGLLNGTYKVIINVDLNSDNIPDETYLKNFVIISGSEFGMVYNCFGPSTEWHKLFVQSFNSYDLQNGTTELYGYSRGSMEPCYFGLEMSSQSNITSIEVLTLPQGVSYSVSNQPTYATENSYATGVYALNLYATNPGIYDIVLKVTTLNRASDIFETYDFNYNIKFYNFPTFATVDLLGISYCLEDGLNFDEITYGLFFNANSLTDKLYVKMPETRIFGFYFDEDKTQELSIDENGYYLTYEDLVFSGKNYVYNNQTGMPNGKKSIIIYAFIEECNYYFNYSANGGVDNRTNKKFIKAYDSQDITLLNVNNGIYYAGKTLIGWQIEDDSEILNLGQSYSASFLAELAGKLDESGAMIYLNAVWSDNLYNIVYDLNSGSGTQPESEINKKYEDTITTASDSGFSNLGYDFSGWIIEGPDDTYVVLANLEQQVGQLVEWAGVVDEPTATITLKASWVLIDYNIVFDFNENQFSNLVYNMSTSQITLPEPNFLTGHLFYWVVSATDSITTWNVGDKFEPAEIINGTNYGNVTLLGEYEPNTFTIEYDTNVGIGNLDYLEQEVVYGEEIFSIEPIENMSVSREYFQLFGYSVNGEMLDLTQSYTISQLATMAGVEDINNSIITLKLEWKGDEYSITYNLLNEKTTGEYEVVELEPAIHIYGTETNLPEPSMIGFKFNGWKLFESEEVLISLGAYDFTDNIVLYGELIEKSYNVSFYDDEGTLYKQIIMLHGQVFDDEHIEFFIPTKPATVEFTYGFAGWFDGLDETSNQILDFTITQNSDFYAKFTDVKNKYSLSLYNEAGSQVLYEITEDYGTIVVLGEMQGTNVVYPEYTATKQSTLEEDFNFNGWYVNNVINRQADEEQVLEINLTENTSLYAGFFPSARVYYIEFYDTNNDTYHLEPVEFGRSILLSNITSPQKAPTEQYVFEFVGWYDNENFEGEPLTEIILTAENYSEVDDVPVLLYPKFESNLRSYTINFFSDNKLYLTKTGYYNEEFNLTEEEFKIEKPADRYYSYEFVGWYESSEDFSGDVVTEFHLTQDTLFYAKFERTAIYFIDSTTGTLLIVLAGLAVVVLAIVLVKYLFIGKFNFKTAKKNTAEKIAVIQERQKEREELEKPIREIKSKSKKDK
jgi:C1A family cysteine protease